MNDTHTVSYDTSAAIVLATKAQTILTSATGIRIDSDTMLELAGDDLRCVKTLQKEVEEKRTSITGPLNAAVKAVNDLFRAPKEYLDQAESSLKRGIATYTAEQQRIAAQARAKAETEARAERERLAALQREQEAAARLAQIQAQAAAEAGDTEEARNAMAWVEKARHGATAAALTAQVVTVTPAIAAPAKVAGISSRTTYNAEVVDLLVLIKAVAEGKAPIECLQADTKFLSAQARAFKKAGEIFPGVQSIANSSVSARAA